MSKRAPVAVSSNVVQHPATAGDTAPRRARADWNPMRPMKPQTMKEAVQLASGVPVKRAIGHSMIEDGDITGGRFALAEADSMERIAAEYMDIGNHVTGPVRPGNGGELVVPTKEAWASIPGVLCTVQESPDMLSATASRERLELTGNALEMAVDAAASIQAKNSLERMLAHEMASAHRLGMLFAEQAASLLERARPQHAFGPINQQHSVEAARMANAAARMMGAFQDAFLALDRVRRGGKQTVKVVHQHVVVGPGGQAVVAAEASKEGAVSAVGKAGDDQYIPWEALWSGLAEERQPARQP